MSRVGKMPLSVPKGVDVTLTGETISVKGSMGTLVRPVNALVTVKNEEGRLLFAPANDSVEADAMSGTMRALVANMVGGVTKGFEKRLALVGVGFRASAQGSLIVHALRQLDLELLPQLTWSAGEYRYTHELDATRYWFGKLTANSVSATFRASYTFTPQLTLQAYAQAFLAIGHYEDMRSLPTATTTGTEVTLAQLTPLPPMGAPVPPITPDFKDAALNINVVFRWEYRLGSTIYLVYSRSQIPSVPVPAMGFFTNPTALDPRNFGHGGTSDVILLKFSSWWAS